MYYIGIDVGTTSICGVLYDATTGHTENMTLPNASKLTDSDLDKRLQTPERIYEIVESILSRFLNSGKEIAAIGVTGQMHGMLYTDKDGKAVSPLVTWQDGRGNRKINSSETYVDLITRITGHHVATGYGLVTHFFNQHNGLVPPEAAHIATIMDYLTMRLTGATTPLTDSSNAASLGLFDKSNLQFDKEAIEKLDIDTSILPEVVRDNSFIGKYEGIPVFSAIGDNQAAFIGSVTNKNEAVHITVGTSSQISVYSPEYIDLPTLDTRPLPGGGYIIAGAELCGGYSIALLKNFFVEVVKQITGATPNEEVMFEAMSTMPTGGEAPLKVETQFDGTRQNPGKRGSITGISSTNFLPGNLVEGFLHGICDALYNYYTLLPEELRADKKMIVASGNGLRKNQRLREIFEETFQLPMVLSGSEEEAACGAAIFARQCNESQS